MGNAIADAVSAVGSATVIAYAEEEMPRRFRRAANLSFGIYESFNDGRDVPVLSNEVLSQLEGPAQDIWRRGYGGWMDNFNLPPSDLRK
jgi:hypothetical protein